MPLIDSKIAIELFRSISKIRIAEETIAERYGENKMRCPTHLCIGQEAVAAAIGIALRKNDFAVSTHRAHGHYLGKGGDLKAMMAEIYGKVTGCGKGRGGSMHLIDKNAGFMGSTAIVGGTIPLGVGLGLSIQLHKTDQVSCVFLGDGAVEEGVFYESMNFAVLKKLPVLFVCENNLYSVYSPLSVRQPDRRQISNMVAGIGCVTTQADGNNAPEVYDLAVKSLMKIRNGEGPVFLELFTYRWREHCGPSYDNDLGYRSKEEFESWKKRDPLVIMKNYILKNHFGTENDLDAICKSVVSEVNDAFIFAEQSPFPDKADLSGHIYSEGC